MTDIEKLKKGLQCCQTEKYGDLEHCEGCPYNEVSICVQECRTALSRDALRIIGGMEEKMAKCCDALTDVSMKISDLDGAVFAATDYVMPEEDVG